MSSQIQPMFNKQSVGTEYLRVEKNVYLYSIFEAEDKVYYIYRRNESLVIFCLARNDKNTSTLFPYCFICNKYLINSTNSRIFDHDKCTIITKNY